jgi:hypothetical protein
MDEGIKLFIVLASIGLAGSLTYASIAIIGAVVNRIKGTHEPDVSPEELEYLRDRAEQVTGLEERVAELETRLDFAERLLPRPHDDRHDTPVGRP